MLNLFAKKTRMPTAADALPGRPEPIPTATTHFVNGRPLKGPYPAGLETADLRHGLLLGGRAQVLAGRRGRSTSPRSATPAALRPIRPITRPAAAAPGTPRPCWSSTIREKSPTSSC